MAQQTDHVPEVMNMLTAVEWFYDRLKWVNRDVYNEMTTQFEEAKQREKEQMHKCASFWRGKENEIEKPIFEQYYKHTFNK